MLKINFKDNFFHYEHSKVVIKYFYIVLFSFNFYLGFILKKNESIMVMNFVYENHKKNFYNGVTVLIVLDIQNSCLHIHICLIIILAWSHQNFIFL